MLPQVKFLWCKAVQRAYALCSYGLKLHSKLQLFKFSTHQNSYMFKIPRGYPKQAYPNWASIK
jgi:hypothetical protein